MGAERQTVGLIGVGLLGMFGAGALAASFGGDVARAGAVTGLVYALGLLAAWWVPGPPGEALDG